MFRTTMPVTEMSFPSITICKQGVDLTAVKKALELDFEAWKLRQEDDDSNKRRKRSAVDIDTFLKEKLEAIHYTLN